MNIRSLNYFVTIVEKMSFTKAAQILNISQQALSGHIKRLEEEFNVSFFQRRPALRLTKEGEEFLFYAKQILQAEKNINAALSDISQNSRAILRVGMSRMRSKAFFPIIWKRYYPHHKNISIELVNANSASLNALLDAGKIDLFIGVDIQTSPQRKKIHLASEHLLCCFTSGLLRKHYPHSWKNIIDNAKVQGLNLKEIYHLPFMVPRIENNLRTTIEQYLSNKYRPLIILECDEQEIIYQFAKLGHGAGIVSQLVPYIFGNNKLSSEDFLCFPIAGNISQNEVSLIYRTDYPLPLFALEFIECASSVFLEHR